MDPVTFLYATAPDEATASRIARRLVDAGAAACVNLIPGMKSVYRWEGETVIGDEVVLIVKTAASAADTARRLIGEAHPHEVPAIVAFEIDERRSSRIFCDWVRNAVISRD